LTVKVGELGVLTVARPARLDQGERRPTDAEIGADSGTASRSTPVLGGHSIT